MIDHVRKAWDIPCPNSQTKLVLIRIADRCNEQHWCNPGYSSLARDCCCSVRAVIRGVKWLESAGVIKVRRTKNDANPSKNNTNLYYFKGTASQSPPYCHRVTQRDHITDATLCHGENKTDCAVPKAGASGGDNGNSASRRGRISDGEFCERLVESHKDCPF